ncbi:MAG TPA: TylF/MycF/NovP-related O-methyltransferase [Gaiellaceae bacterium]|nr:TylF/MycF/NovP-related O-methyltransferase [Gaiellaceae bacterium]
MIRPAPTRNAATLYLDLLKRSLCGMLTEDPAILPESGERVAFDPARRWQRRDWPTSSLTMMGMSRLENLERCIVDVLREHVPGDLIETGVWRGGASIFMRGVLAAYGDTGRRVFVADSFQGLPKPDPETFPQDEGDRLWTRPELAVPMEEVKANFERYGLLDDQVQFLPGWFRDTLPSAPVNRLALLRLDGDLYESTIVALEALYPKLSSGGYVIVDDYALETCRAAVDDYRERHSITEELGSVDWTGVYWRKEA